MLPIIFHILSNLGFHKNTHHIATKIGPENYAISTRKPKNMYLVGQSKKPNKTHSKARYDTASLKFVTI